jgi:hypothetical protein
MASNRARDKRDALCPGTQSYASGPFQRSKTVQCSPKRLRGERRIRQEAANGKTATLMAFIADQRAIGHQRQ